MRCCCRGRKQLSTVTWVGQVWVNTWSDKIAFSIRNELHVAHGKCLYLQRQEVETMLLTKVLMVCFTDNSEHIICGFILCLFSILQRWKSAPFPSKLWKYFTCINKICNYSILCSKIVLGGFIPLERFIIMSNSAQVHKSQAPGS